MPEPTIAGDDEFTRTAKHIDPQAWSDLRFYFDSSLDVDVVVPFGYDDLIFDAACDWEPLDEEGPETLTRAAIDEWIAEQESILVLTVVPE